MTISDAKAHDYIADLEKWLYRAVRELSYIHEITFECVPDKSRRSLIQSAEGVEIVEEGMKLLRVKDLSEEEITEMERIL